MLSNSNILVTGVERSGSTLVMRILEKCGAELGQTNKMKENIAIQSLNRSFIKVNSNFPKMPDLKNINIPLTWGDIIERVIEDEEIPDGKIFAYKDSGLAQIWPLWHCAFPNYKWIIVRRRTGDIIHSCTETAYMDRFKRKIHQRLVGVDSQKEGWLWWVHEYEKRFNEMHEANLNYKVVWPERMRDGFFDQIKETVEWCGLEWNEEVIPMMQKLLK